MRTLIKNAFVVSVDPAIGNVDGADILVEHGRIAAVRPGLAEQVDPAGCEVIDATGHIASPGFVDTHHHVWQSAVRGITADWSIRDYVSGIRLFVASCFRPQDMYAAQWGGMLQALREGVTTTADYCHNLNSPDHVEESIRGLQASGARVVWSYGFNRPPLPNPAFASLEDREAHLRQTAARHFASKDSLLTLAVSPEESWFWPETAYGVRQFRVARELDARIFWHANSTRNIFDGTPRRDAGRLIEQGLLGPDLTLVHMNHSQPDEWQAVADAGSHVSITPETELQMNMGWPVIEETRLHGVNIGLGIDILSNNSADLRFQLRLLLQAGRRMLGQDVSGSMDQGVPISCAQALHWGTLGGARALGLERDIGSLTPGKSADILLHDARGISMIGWPRDNPEAALLLHAGADTLSTVMVAGRCVKRAHRLVADEAGATAALGATHEYLLARFEAQGGLSAAMAQPIARFAANKTAVPSPARRRSSACEERDVTTHSAHDSGIDATHDPSLQSWVESANDPDTDFPIQNLPFGRFRLTPHDEWRIGAAIGDQVLDLAQAELLSGDASRAPTAMHALMAWPPKKRRALRHALSEALREGAQVPSRMRAALRAQAEVELGLPCEIGDYTDFFTGIHHALSVGRQFRPDTPLLPNYKWVPIGYHGRASSIGPSGESWTRPWGQTLLQGAEAPVHAPSLQLDYELELAMFIGTPNARGCPVEMTQAESHVFGVALLNDWSARDIQRWEYQPLGPFLAKSFATTVSPWVVTMEALAPFRKPFIRPQGDPDPMPYLDSPANRAAGAIDIAMEVWIETTRMREAGLPAQRLSRANFTDAYWTIAQLVAHHTVNGCNLRTGDMFGSGTISGPGGDQGGSLLELGQGGARPLTLANGEQRAFLEDGDTVILRGVCQRPGARRIGFGECRGTVLPGLLRTG